MIGNLVGTLIGAMISILTIIVIEATRRPKLRMRVKEPIDMTYGLGAPARSGRYLHVHLINEPLPRFLRWLARDAAMQCRGTITFHNLDHGDRFFAKPLPLRFSDSVEPVPMQIQIGDQTGAIIDPLRFSLESRADLYPGQETPFDTAVKFDGEPECYAWSNHNYFSRPLWKDPNWKLPPGRYLVSVRVISNSARCSGVFRLLNQGTPGDFRLEDATAEEWKKIELH